MIITLELSSLVIYIVCFDDHNDTYNIVKYFIALSSADVNVFYTVIDHLRLRCFSLNVMCEAGDIMISYTKNFFFHWPVVAQYNGCDWSSHTLAPIGRPTLCKRKPFKVLLVNNCMP